MNTNSVTNSISFLGKVVTVKTDRPLGSRHPKYGFSYPVNYGYIPQTLAPDGEELDAYILLVADPVTEYQGVCTAIIHRLNDQDDKLVVIPTGCNISDAEIEAATEFQEKWFKHIIIRK